MMENFGCRFFLLNVTFLSAQTHAQTFDLPEVAFGGPNDESNSPYFDWVKNYGSDYHRSLFMPSAADPSKGIALHWRIGEARLSIAVTAKAGGWVGLGFSENGGMRGADIVYFEAQTPNTVTDSYVLSDLFPLVDDCQDWTLTRSFTEDGFLIFEANRLLDTGDDQDRSLIYDAPEASVASRVIAAWGDDPSISYHGATDHARGQVRWFQGIDEATSFADTMLAQAEGSFEHRANNYTVGTEETQYVSFCIGREDLVAQGVPMDADPLYLIGFEPIVDERAEAFVHHFVTTGSDGYSEASIDCSIDQGISQVYAWAPGETAYALPEFLGLPFGDAEGLTGLRMVIHYDNPNAVENIMDSSGVRYYYTTKPRQHEVGTMAMGDIVVRKAGEKVGGGLMEHVFECPSTCSSSVLDEPVTVLREYLHMHRKGVSGRIEQLRNGIMVRSGQVDFFDFDQQGNHVIQQPEYEVLPGDSFRLVCEYNASPDHVFGKGSDDEMCMSQIYYYPRKSFFRELGWICPFGIPLPLCSADYAGARTLESEEELGRIFGQEETPTDIPEAENPDDGEDTEENAGEETNPVADEPPISAGGTSILGNHFLWLLTLGFVRHKLGSKRLLVPLLVDF